MERGAQYYVDRTRIYIYKYLIIKFGVRAPYVFKSNSNAGLSTILKASAEDCPKVPTGLRETHSVAPIACFSQICSSDRSRSARRGTWSLELSIFLNSSSIS